MYLDCAWWGDRLGGRSFLALFGVRRGMGKAYFERLIGTGKLNAVELIDNRFGGFVGLESTRVRRGKEGKEQDILDKTCAS